MNCIRVALFVFVSIVISNPAYCQFDLFYSTSELNSGASNGPLDVDLDVGTEASVFAYYTTNGPSMSEIDSGGFFQIETDNPGVIEFVGGETFQFDISIGGVPVSQRWQNFGPGAIQDNGQTIFLTVFNVTAGEGMLNQNTGTVFLDQGYDPAADAFLFARVDFRVIGEGSASLLTSVRAGGVVNQGQSLVPVFGTATVTTPKPLTPLGDLNGDGLVTLLDISLFVDLLINGEYDPVADFDANGSVDLVDVQPFIDAIDFP